MHVTVNVESSTKEERKLIKGSRGRASGRISGINEAEGSRVRCSPYLPKFRKSTRIPHSYFSPSSRRRWRVGRSRIVMPVGTGISSEFAKKFTLAASASSFVSKRFARRAGPAIRRTVIQATFRVKGVSPNRLSSFSSYGSKYVSVKRLHLPVHVPILHLVPWGYTFLTRRDQYREARTFIPQFRPSIYGFLPHQQRAKTRNEGERRGKNERKVLQLSTTRTFRGCKLPETSSYPKFNRTRAWNRYAIVIKVVSPNYFDNYHCCWQRHVIF